MSTSKKLATLALGTFMTFTSAVHGFDVAQLLKDQKSKNDKSHSSVFKETKKTQEKIDAITPKIYGDQVITPKDIEIVKKMIKNNKLAKNMNFSEYNQKLRQKCVTFTADRPDGKPLKGVTCKQQDAGMVFSLNSR
jgi:hypothetical protein